MVAIPRVNQAVGRGDPLPDYEERFSVATIKEKTEQFMQGTCFNDAEFVRKLTEGYNQSWWYSSGFPKFADSIDDIRKNLI